MKKWRGTPQSFLLIIGLLLGAAFVPTISGCSQDVPNALGRSVQAVSDFLKPLPEEAQVEFNRFAQEFRRTATDAAENDEQLDYFGFAFKRIRTHYVRPVEDAKLIDAAIKGVGEKTAKSGKITSAEIVETALDSMTASLDPHSGYLNPDEYKESFVHTKGEFGGLGIEVTMEEGLVKVVAPIEDTPAFRAGLVSGDLIVDVDGEPIKGLTLAQAVRRMRGPPGEPIRLLIRRKGTADFHVDIVRAVIKVRAVRWQTMGRIAYVRVSRFSERVETGIVAALKTIRSELGGDPEGVILDLRNNPGGLLDQSIHLADAFLDEGEIVSVRGRATSNRRSFVAERGDIAASIPMVVLINGGSASASEIVASALKYHGRATVMGGRSFGKGSVQTIIPMQDRGALRLTTALYYGPDGHTIQGRGITPDIVIKTDTETAARKRESDLPGAIKANDPTQNKGTVVIAAKACPATESPRRTGRDPVDDRDLGCALAFFEAGSEDKFIAAHGGRSQM